MLCCRTLAVIFEVNYIAGESNLHFKDEKKNPNISNNNMCSRFAVLRVAAAPLL